METKYGLNLKIDEVGNVKLNGGNNFRKLKVIARKALKIAFIQSACVYDGHGNALFYLKKLANGSMYEEEIHGIPAERVETRAK